MLTMRQIFVVMGIFSFLFGGCTKRPGPTPQSPSMTQSSKPLMAPPEVTSEAEEGFHDLLFYIQDFKRLPDGSQSIRVLGKHKGRQLGLEIVLSPTWKAGSLGENVPLVTYRGVISYRSVGSDSDVFAQVLDEIYGTKVGLKTMSKETQFTGISLGGDPRDLDSGAVKMKLFFESDKEAEYAELYTNIRLADHRLEICEKDPGYRLAIVKALQPR